MGTTKNFKPRHRPLTDREEQAREKQPGREAVQVTPSAQPAHERLAARAEEYRDSIEARSASRRPYYVIRRDRDFTDAKKEIFVFTIGELGTTAAAAEAAGVSIGTAYAHRNKNQARYDPDFAEAWQEAAEEYNAGVEREFHNRAIIGWQEPVFGGKEKDRIVGHVTKKSDKLLIELAKRRMPKEYGNKVEVNQPGGSSAASTEIMPGIDITKLTADQRKNLKSFLTSMDGVDRSEVVEAEYSEEEPYDLIETQEE